MIFRDSASAAGIIRRNSLFTVMRQSLRCRRHKQRQPHLHHVTIIARRQQQRRGCCSTRCINDIGDTDDDMHHQPC